MNSSIISRFHAQRQRWLGLCTSYCVLYRCLRTAQQPALLHQKRAESLKLHCGKGSNTSRCWQVWTHSERSHNVLDKNTDKLEMIGHSKNILAKVAISGIIRSDPSRQPVREVKQQGRTIPTFPPHDRPTRFPPAEMQLTYLTSHTKPLHLRD